MKKKDAKVAWNSHISMIASNHENDIRRVCKDANIYYPPAWYKSSRGTSFSLIDQIFYDIEIEQCGNCKHYTAQNYGQITEMNCQNDKVPVFGQLVSPTFGCKGFENVK